MKCVVLSFKDVPIVAIYDPGKDNEIIRELLDKGHHFKAEWMDTGDEKYTKERAVMHDFNLFVNAVQEIADREKESKEPKGESSEV